MKTIRAWGKYVKEIGPPLKFQGNVIPRFKKIVFIFKDLTVRDRK